MTAPAAFSMGGNATKICPDCLYRDRLRWNRLGLFMSGLIVAAVPVLYLLRPDVYHELRPLVLFFACSVVLWPTCVMLHQTGHAAVGRILGLSVYAARPRWMHRRSIVPMNSTIVRDAAAGALHWILPDARRAQRWRIAAMLLAGPAVNLILLVAVIIVDPPPTRLRDWPWDAWAVALALINVTLLFISLLPVMMPTRGGKIGSDGLQLWHVLRYRQWSTLVRRQRSLALEAALQVGDIAGAVALARRLPIRDFADFSVVMAHLWTLAAERDWRGVTQLAARAVTAATSAPQYRFVLLAWQAVGEIYAGGDLEQAAKWCDEMERMAPWDSSGKVVFAALRFAQNRLAEAEAMLDLADGAKSQAARAAEAWLRLAIQHCNGNEAASRRAERAALRIDALRIYEMPAAASIPLSPPLLSSH